MIISNSNKIMGLKMGITERDDLVPVTLTEDYEEAQDIVSILIEHDIEAELVEDYQEDGTNEEMIAVLVPDHELADAQDIVSQYHSDDMQGTDDEGEDLEDDEADEYKDFGEFDPKDDSSID